MTAIQLGSPRGNVAYGEGRSVSCKDENIYWIKYMKNSASESIRNAYFNLERHSCSCRLARPGISTAEWLSGFDSDAESSMYLT